MPKEHDFESQIRNIISDWFSANTYNTGWLLNQIGGVGSPDWTNVHLGDDPSQDSNVNHNLDAPLSDLLVKALISTDGTDNNSYEIMLLHGKADIFNRDIFIDRALVEYLGCIFKFYHCLLFPEYRVILNFVIIRETIISSPVISFRSLGVMLIL